MSDAIVRTGLAGLPPSNVQASNTYNPTAGPGPSAPTHYPPGTPVVPSAIAGKTVVPGRANDVDTSSLVGLAAEPAVVGEPVLVQTHGVLTLTTAQWDAITGESGGLERDIRYYLSAASPGGHLIGARPSAPGTFAVSAGIALSRTDFLIQICPPEENEDNG